MRLIALRLLNFRQHADTRIQFGPGLTGIIGPNGAGKSTILEAIAWAIYGSSAARGTNETIRFSHAPVRARVEVDLRFQLSGRDYRVVRGLTRAELFINDASRPAARGIAAVTAFLQARLGMDRDEFFNTYFTGQKELQFLGQLGPAQRGRFLGQLLGYERLRLVQDRVRARRNELRHQLDGLHAGLTDQEALAARLAQAVQRQDQLTDQLTSAEAQLRAADTQFHDAHVRWQAAQTQWEAARELHQDLDAAQREVEAARRDRDRVEQELASIGDAGAELAELQRQLEELPAIARRSEQLTAAARRAERRTALVESERALAAEVAEATERLETLEQAPELVAQYSAELAELRPRFETLEARLEAYRAEWSQRQQEVRTRLEGYRQRAQDLKQQIRTLREAGPEGVCPTCQRPLDEEYANVLARLDDEYYTLIQDGKWLNQRERQLAVKPEELSQTESEHTQLRATLEDRAERLARCEQAVQELWTLAGDRTRKTARLEQLRADLAELPADYRPADHAAVDQRLGELRRLETRAARLTQIMEARETRVREREEAEQRVAQASARAERLHLQGQALGIDAAQLDGLRQIHETADQARRTAELHLVEVKGQLEAAREALQAVQDDARNQAELIAAVQEVEDDLRHHQELDAALTKLRTRLNARVRPELAELASSFLAEITAGRYAYLEIDEDYNVTVTEEGEEKPVISGGEEDIANLVLRLAISQMIAERAGQPLSVLILDDVFGSLDVERRDQVVQLLRRLASRFEQVILITHVESIREGLDHVVRVQLDEETGATRVIEEVPAASVSPVSSV